MTILYNTPMSFLRSFCILLIFLAFGCDSQPEATSSIETVPQLNVSADEERIVTTTEIQSLSDITIKGKLLFQLPDDPEIKEVKITAKSGNIKVDGFIGFTPRKTQQSRFFEKMIHLIFRNEAIAQPAAVSQPYYRNILDVAKLVSGRSITLIATNVNIELTALAKIVAEDGPPAPLSEIPVGLFQDIDFSTGIPLREGGSISLFAPGGYILFFGEPHLQLGNGADGVHIRLDDSGLSGQGRNLLLVAMDGSKAGQLKLNSRELRFSGVTEPAIKIEGGKGGKGGDIFCSIQNEHEIESFAALRLVAGRGGEGSVEAGDGGNITCDISDKPVNKLGEPTTLISAAAGDGGNLKAPDQIPHLVHLPGQQPFPTASYYRVSRAGHGGIALVTGFSGRDGKDDASATTTEKAGAKSGDVDISYGDGGNVVDPSFIFPPSQVRAGDGGISAIQRQGMTQISGLGNAGKGGSGCHAGGDFPEGGNGGNGGKLNITAGKGGNCPIAGCTPGNGGHVYQNLIYNPVKAGKGGDGTPPGNGGVSETKSYGAGGAGTNGEPSNSSALVRGQDGELKDPDPIPQQDGDNGTACPQQGSTGPVTPPALCKDRYAGAPDTMFQYDAQCRPCDTNQSLWNRHPNCAPSCAIRCAPVSIPHNDYSLCRLCPTRRSGVCTGTFDYWVGLPGCPAWTETATTKDQVVLTINGTPRSFDRTTTSIREDNPQANTVRLTIDVSSVDSLGQPTSSHIVTDYDCNTRRWDRNDGQSGTTNLDCPSPALTALFCVRDPAPGSTNYVLIARDGTRQVAGSGNYTWEYECRNCGGPPKGSCRCLGNGTVDCP